jgi:hypothetical protein
MRDTESVLDADLRYAVRMVQSGCSTPEQAAQTCGISVTLLREQLHASAAATAPACVAYSLNTP